MIVAHVTDSHIIKPEDQYSKIAKSRIENLEKFVSNILELKIKPDAVSRQKKVTLLKLRRITLLRNEFQIIPICPFIMPIVRTIF